MSPALPPPLKPSRGPSVPTFRSNWIQNTTSSEDSTTERTGECPSILIVWDAEDDPNGNFQHIVGADEVTAEEVEEVLSDHPGNHPDAYSDATGNPIISGTTSTGKRIAVVYSDESDADLIIIRPVAAYPVRE